MLPGAQIIVSHARTAIYPRIMEVPTGSNDGPALRRFLANTGFQPGDSYCMFFALACLLAYFRDPHQLPESVGYSGSCQMQYEHAKSVNHISEYAATGAIFLLANNAGHYHHAGIVTGVIKPTMLRPYPVVQTVEGNTGSHPGLPAVGCYERERKESDLEYIIW